LREALRCLCILGILRARAGEGTIVDLDGGRFFGKIVEWRVITEQPDIEDMMELRIALESVTAASAASLRTEKDLGKLRQLLDEMADTVNKKALFAAMDLQFHLILADICDNALIRDLVSMIRKQLEITVSRALELPNARPLSIQEHEFIFQAIKRGDANAAHAAMNHHLGSAMERYRSSPSSTARTEAKLVKVRRRLTVS
jgi:GntR family transcriptional repressor for pyruvate dehydrogenase complex